MIRFAPPHVLLRSTYGYQHSTPFRGLSFHALLLSFYVLIGLMGCAPEPAARVVIEVDGERRLLAVGESQTVGDLLTREDILLSGNDRVEPSSFTLLSPNLAIRVIRVQEREVQEEQTVPFARETRRDASLPQGESRLLQLGSNGREEVTVRVILENGVEVAREVVSTQLLQAPVNEVYVIGTRGSGTPVTFTGTIVYMQQGNAWLMREDSSRKRALTLTGDLDGLVFALSPDGRWLLFTREPLGGASGQGGPLNSLWLLDTRIVNEEPRPLEIENVLWAEWQPCPTTGECPLQVAFSTGERVPTPPGWRANNDLQRFGMNTEGARGEIVPVVASNLPVFGWWGRQWAWSPTGTEIAWGDATRLGVVSLENRQERILAQFQPFETNASWVWTPQLAWSPEGRYLTATIHRAQDSVDPEASTRFDLLRFEPATNEFVVLEENVGPFAMPMWVPPTALIYGQVEDPASPVTSRYRIMARRGTGTPQAFFPAAAQPGVDIPATAASPLGESVLALWQEDLYLVPLTNQAPLPLTNEGGISHARWAR
jgi:resuscitation-promoting factor RpfB